MEFSNVTVKSRRFLCHKSITIYNPKYKTNVYGIYMHIYFMPYIYTI